MKITQAIISAGGRGERLRPFTDHAPKPMLPILGKPLLEWHIEQFKKYGVRDFIFTLGYLHEVVTKYFGDGSRFGVTIRYHIEQTPLGSFGSMRDIKGIDENFYFIYGDVFSLLDYGKMKAVYEAKRAPIGMQRVGRTEEENNSADHTELDQQSRFVAMHSKVKTKEHSNVYSLRGASILNKRMISYAGEGPAGLGYDVIPRAVAAGENFYGYECEEYSKGINTFEERDEVEKYLNDNHIAPWW